MYFLRWIAGYPILIILLVVGLYALYNKDNLTQWFEKNDASEQIAESGHRSEIASTEDFASDNEQSAGVVDGLTASEAPQPVLEITEPGYPADDVAMSSPELDGIPLMPEMGEMPPMPDMNDIPLMPEMGGMPPLSEMGDIPPMPEFGDDPRMPEMKEFSPIQPFPETPMEPAFIPPKDEPAAMMAPPAMDDNMGKATADAETAKVEKEEKSGSWVDIFKKKAEPEEASPPAQQDAPVTAIEVEPSADVEAAKAEQEEKTSSWLDIFKPRKKEPSTEIPADDTSGELQLQQNESLRMAREAFWQRDFDAAETIYMNMTKAEPENAELLGEYGNVLLEAGKMGEALDVYEQVAELLIAEGRTFELRPLLYFISDQDPERAHKLSQKMQAQPETNN